MASLRSQGTDSGPSGNDCPRPHLRRRGGRIVESGGELRIISRFLAPQIELDCQLFATLRQPFRFFIKEVALDLPPAGGKLDARFAVGCISSSRPRSV